MTRDESKAEAEKIIKKHYETIKYHLPLHDMTAMEMDIMAEAHSVLEVEGVIKALPLQDYRTMFFTKGEWESILTELNKM